MKTYCKSVASIFISTFFCVGVAHAEAPPTSITVYDLSWSAPMQESGKKTGGHSQYTCPSNQVMVGRYHQGDENGDTKYQCAKVKMNSTNLTLGGASWSAPMQESGKKTNGHSQYTCPNNQIMVGRYHEGDENGETKYQCAPINKYNDRAAVLSDYSWSAAIQESGKNSSGYSQYTCPSNKVMVGRYHEGDEDGITKYQCAYVSYPYVTVPLQSHYVGESTSCVWQSPQKCPPYVFYYTEAQLQPLKLTVKNNKLYNSSGNLFDTRGADPSHSGPKAIFVMDTAGNIYGSNAHVVFLFHHSTFLAGRPVAAAGELSVTDGVINNMTSCSGHYRPAKSVTQQAIESLGRQGYTHNISYNGCTGALKMDLDYRVVE